MPHRIEEALGLILTTIMKVVLDFGVRPLDERLIVRHLYIYETRIVPLNLTGLIRLFGQPVYVIFLKFVKILINF